MRNWLQKFMYGRCGPDQFSLFLMGLYLVLYLVANLFRLKSLVWLSLLVAAYAAFRMFSKNLPKRRSENSKFITTVDPALRWLRTRRSMRKDKEHCYFKCPNCGQRLRVPKGKGKITVTCRNCGVSFEEKS